VIEGLFGRGSVPALDTLMRFAEARHRAIAGNIANVDTVGYRTLDAPVARFDQALARAFQTGDFAMRSDVLRPETAADAGTLKTNGNNVDLDIEMAKMVRNQSLFGMAAALLAQQFSMMREAISGHVSA
jgi:flagellar basal-body rod protein FlgB